MKFNSIASRESYEKKNTKGFYWVLEAPKNALRFVATNHRWHLKLHKSKGFFSELEIFETDIFHIKHVTRAGSLKDFEEFVCCLTQHEFYSNR